MTSEVPCEIPGDNSQWWTVLTLPKEKFHFCCWKLFPCSRIAVLEAQSEEGPGGGGISALSILGCTSRLAEEPENTKESIWKPIHLPGWGMISRPFYPWTYFIFPLFPVHPILLVGRNACCPHPSPLGLLHGDHPCLASISSIIGCLGLGRTHRKIPLFCWNP